MLIREELSRRRALAFLLCAGLLAFVAGLLPWLVVDAASSEGSEAADVAVTIVLAVVMLAVFAVPALLVLRALRKRSIRRFELLRQWAAVDRGHDSEFPTSYGTQGNPHGRFFYASLVLVLALILALAFLIGSSNPSTLALLPCPVVAGLFSWSTIRKYAGRYSWSERERVIRTRARRRERHRTQVSQASSATVEAPATFLVGIRIHPALLYAAILSPAVIVTLVFVVVRPNSALGLGLAGLVALAILVLGLPMVVLRRRRERAEIDSAARSLTSAFVAGTVAHPVRYGLGEPGSQADTSAVLAWDLAPTRSGALAVDAGTLRLRGTDGASLDLPLTELQGTALIRSGVAWLPPSVDVLLRSGEAIEFRSSDARAIVDALTSAGVPAITSY